MEGKIKPCQLKSVEELTQEVIREVRKIAPNRAAYPISDMDIATIAGLAFMVLTKETTKNKNTRSQPEVEDKCSTCAWFKQSGEPLACLECVNYSNYKPIAPQEPAAPLATNQPAASKAEEEKN